MLAASVLFAYHVEDHLHILGVGEWHVGQLEALKEDLDIVTVLLALGEQTPLLSFHYWLTLAPYSMTLEIYSVYEIDSRSCHVLELPDGSR